MRIRKHSLLPALLLAYAVAVAKDNKQLQSQLNAEFRGKQFTLKVSIARYLDAKTEDGGDAVRWVDTEFSQDGTLKYYVRQGAAGNFMAAFHGSYIDAAQVTAMSPAGTQMFVTSIDLKENRIELMLHDSEHPKQFSDYGKLKFMFGSGYQNWAYDAIVENIAHTLVVERFERFVRLQDEYQRLKAEIAAIGSGGSASTLDASARLTAAEKLRGFYVQLAINRELLAALGRKSNEAADFRQRARELDAEIGVLRSAARTQRIAQLQEQARTRAGEAQTLRAHLRGRKAAHISEWEQRRQTAMRYNQLLTEQKNTYDELASNSAAMSPAATRALEQQTREAAALVAAIETERGGIAALELSAQYQAMQRKRIQLQTAYMAAFGTSGADAAMQVLVGHLQQMYENRMAAEQAGSKSAHAQAAQLLKDIQKFR